MLQSPTPVELDRQCDPLVLRNSKKVCSYEGASVCLAEDVRCARRADSRYRVGDILSCACSRGWVDRGLYLTPHLAGKLSRRRQCEIRVGVLVLAGGQFLCWGLGRRHRVAHCSQQRLHNNRRSAALLQRQQVVLGSGIEQHHIRNTMGPDMVGRSSRCTSQLTNKHRLNVGAG